MNFYHRPFTYPDAVDTIHLFGAKKLFNEALQLYLASMRDHNMVPPPQRQSLLIAINGLVQLNDYPLARALLRVCFSDLTADDHLLLLEKARQAQRDLDCYTPF